MSTIGYLDYTFSSETLSDFQKNREKDRENSTLLKIAACIPFIGLFINRIASRSIDQKLKNLPLPRKFRNPELMTGATLDENATLGEKKAACQKAIELISVQKGYNKAALVNSILTIALVIYALAISVIPIVIAGILIGAFSLTAVIFIYGVCSDRSIKRYEEAIETYV